LSPQAGPSFPLYLPMSLQAPLSPGGVFLISSPCRLALVPRREPSSPKTAQRG
jgi:hypothetical protein